MRGTKHFRRLGAGSAIFVVTLLVTNSWAASHRVLVSFNGTNGNGPIAGLISDAQGNFYGTTDTGGTSNFGTVYKLSQGTGGSWTETVLHNFTNDGHDGTHPFGQLVFDGQGNLYGTTYRGGAHDFGTVFELSPAQGGSWTESILHNFSTVANVGDGSFPEAGLIFDGQGNLYGTTYGGGTHGSGTVFELTPNGNGTWTKHTLRSFGGGTDGANPNSNLIFDAQGNLYGTSYAGGRNNVGTVYELSPNGSGGWTERLLHSFALGADGSYPVESALIFDSQGNLYGTTSQGGTHAKGTVYKLTPNGSGGWTTSILHSFGSGTDGVNPFSGLTMDGQGNLYGTTFNGGSANFGTVFKLTPNGGGWSETILHSLAAGSDASHPYGPLFLDSQGNLYGTSYNGGTHAIGTVFEITP